MQECWPTSKLWFRAVRDSCKPSGSTWRRYNTHTGKEENEQVAHDLRVAEVGILETGFDEFTEDIGLMVDTIIAGVLDDIHEVRLPSPDFTLKPMVQIPPCSVNLLQTIAS